MGGTEQANMSGLMVYCKKYEDLLRGILDSDSVNVVKTSGLYDVRYNATILRIGPIQTTLITSV